MLLNSVIPCSRSLTTPLSAWLSKSCPQHASIPAWVVAQVCSPPAETVTWPRPVWVAAQLESFRASNEVCELPANPTGIVLDHSPSCHLFFVIFDMFDIFGS